MWLKIWNLVISGVLIGMGASRAIPNADIDAWEVVVCLGVFALVITVGQIFYDYGEPKGWWQDKKKGGAE